MGDAYFIRDLIILPGVIAFLIILAISPFLYTKIVRHYDRQFGDKEVIFERGIWFISFFLRLANYTLCIVFPNRSKKDRYHSALFSGYDFRGNASKAQIALSFAYLLSILIIVVFGFILIAYDLIIAPTVFGVDPSQG